MERERGEKKKSPSETAAARQLSLLRGAQACGTTWTWTDSAWSGAQLMNLVVEKVEA